MSLKPPHVQHLVMELRYDPALIFYTQMDRFGLDFAEQYPDWERSPLTLDIRNKKFHRRGFFSYRRAFFESVGFEGLELDSDGTTKPFTKSFQSEIDHGTKLFEKVHHLIRLTKVPRFGMRAWWIAESTDTLKTMCKEIAGKVTTQEDRFKTLLRGTLDDVGYSFDVQADLGWKYHLKFGPMEKKQWFEIIPHEVGVFESPEQFNRYQMKFPDRFFYIDLDCYKENIAFSDYLALLLSVKTASSEIATELYNFLKA